MQTFGETAFKGTVLLGKFQGIISLFISIIGFVLFIYGIKLYFTDESNWKKTNVLVTKIKSNNNKTCDKDTLTNKFNNGMTQRTVYNCMLHVNYNNKEVILQVQDSPTNYLVGKNISVWYDSNNPDEDLFLNKILLSKMWSVFLFGGLLLAILGLIFAYYIFKSDNLSAILGTGALVNDISSMFNRR
jgi:energy-coupling factor transporter transmembrane protein EcfT